MNPIFELKRKFKAGAITKPQFIEQMHAHHKRLHDFAASLSETDIAKIEITDGSVVYTSRRYGVKIKTDAADQRPAPLDAFNFGTYEQAETDAMLAHLKPGMTVYDIGANLGWYSVIFAKSVENLKIHAFEPVPSTFNSLNVNLKLNHISNCTVHNHGLSEKSGEISFFYYPEGSVNASAARLTDRANQKELKLPVKTLDETVAVLKAPPHFIKCDVEGAEFLVFKGGEKTLREHKPIVFAEMLRKWSEPFGYHPNDMIAFFATCGYICKAVTPSGLVDFRSMDENTIETNFVFLPK